MSQSDHFIAMPRELYEFFLASAAEQEIEPLEFMQWLDDRKDTLEEPLKTLYDVLVEYRDRRGLN